VEIAGRMYADRDRETPAETPARCVVRPRKLEPRRVAPYIYSDQEIIRLLKAARQLSSAIRHVRGFARHRVATDPRTQIPPPGLLPFR
jgi:hypothetical protein